MAKLSWGFWTQSKLEILEGYLANFLTASSAKASAAFYIDAFAGEGAGKDRLTDEEFDGSARIAATAIAKNGVFRFSHLRLVELNPSRALHIQGQLRTNFPGRDIEVVAGDCNTEIPALLSALPSEVSRNPGFAFLDPFGIELRWETIQALADHKRNRKYKVELFMLFASPAFMRIVGMTPEAGLPDAPARLTALFGCDDWKPIVVARRDGKIEPVDAREAFVNLMRWRLADELGYQRTHVLEFKNSRGSPVYHMVFATDHEAGDKIMAHLYAAAAMRNADMAQDAREHATGVMTLFPASETAPKYEPSPPVEPAAYLASLIADPSAEDAA